LKSLFVHQSRRNQHINRKGLLGSEEGERLAFGKGSFREKEKKMTGIWSIEGISLIKKANNDVVFLVLHDLVRRLKKKKWSKPILRQATDWRGSGNKRVNSSLLVSPITNLPTSGQGKFWGPGIADHTKVPMIMSPVDSNGERKGALDHNQKKEGQRVPSGFADGGESLQLTRACQKKRKKTGARGRGAFRVKGRRDRFLGKKQHNRRAWPRGITWKITDTSKSLWPRC